MAGGPISECGRLFDRAFLKRLRRELPRWREKGWIAAEHEPAILADAAAQAGGARRAPLAFAILGVILFGAGVITFFAANWAEMPKLAKLVVLFGGLWAAYGAAGWLLTRDERGERQFGQALLLLGLILFGANIMLIAQIYHIDSHYPNGVLLWAVGGLALAYLVPASAQPAAVASLVLATLWSGLEVVGGDWLVHWPFLVLWALFLPPILGHGWRYAGFVAMLVLVVWSLVTSLRAIVEFPENRVYLAQIYVLGSIGVAILGIMMERTQAFAVFATTVQRFALLAAKIGFYALTIRIMHGIGTDDWASEPVGAASGRWVAGTLFIGVVLAATLVWHRSHGTTRASPALARWGLGLSAAVVALMLVNVFLPHPRTDPTIVYIAFNLLFFSGLAFLVYAGYEASDTYLVNVGFVFFSAGIVTLYFDVFWTLMGRSYFFMGGGLLLFLGGYLIERQRRRVLGRMGGAAGARGAP